MSCWFRVFNGSRVESRDYNVLASVVRLAEGSVHEEVLSRVYSSTEMSAPANSGPSLKRKVAHRDSQNLECSNTP